MGLFDWFTKREPKPEPKPEAMPTRSLPQLCYDIAYFILPPNTFNDTTQFLHLMRTRPTAGAELYAMACKARQSEPVQEDAAKLVWHFGELTVEKEYFALEYPVPPEIDFLANPPAPGMMVLAPHFSAIIRDTATGAVEYFVLGQAPMGGGTTLRCVTREGSNCNLGPGPEPKLQDFLDAVRGRIARE